MGKKNEMAVSVGNSQMSFWRRLYEQRYMMLLVLPGVVLLIVFYYFPLYGILLAFKDYNPGLGISGSPWAGLKYFREILTDVQFFKSLRNTFIFSFLNLAVGFPVPIIFALMINELFQAKLFKRVVQTISYLPHFLSWAFVASFLNTFLSDRGTLNPLLINFGIIDEPYGFLGNITSFVFVIVISTIWKSFGYSSIIYLAAMTSIPQEMYEAALIDGATRMQKIRYITLPSIRSTVVVLLILQISGMIHSNFEQFYLLQNPLVSEIGKVLDVYTYEVGMQKARFSYATAVGLFKSVVSFALLVIANTVSRRITGEGIY
ncbi:MAG: sugar ABC transporter permease [Clostridiales bacterium]|nr:sugar ABC transporter permease [Clostridiales bacterium]